MNVTGVLFDNVYSNNRTTDKIENYTIIYQISYMFRPFSAILREVQDKVKCSDTSAKDDN